MMNKKVQVQYKADQDGKRVIITVSCDQELTNGDLYNSVTQLFEELHEAAVEEQVKESTHVKN
jgi:hypothetical protein